MSTTSNESKKIHKKSCEDVVRMGLKAAIASNHKQKALAKAAGVSPAQVSNLLNDKPQSLPGQDKLDKLAEGLHKLGITSIDEHKKEVAFLDAIRERVGPELRDRQIPAIAGALSPEACILRWCMAGHAKVCAQDLGAERLPEYQEPLLPTPFYIRPLRRSSVSLVHRTPKEDTGGRLNAPFSLMSLHHAKAIQSWIKRKEWTDATGNPLTLRRLDGFQIRSRPGFVLVQRKSRDFLSSDTPEQSRFRTTCREKGSFGTSLGELRDQLNKCTFVVEKGTDLAAKTELLCKLLGISVLERAPGEKEAESYPHWAVCADPIRTSSAIQLLCSGALGEKCIVVAEAPHFWAIRNRQDLEILVLDSDLFPERSLKDLPMDSNDSVEFDPMQYSTGIGNADPTEQTWMPPDYVDWRSDEPKRNPELGPTSCSFLSPKEFCRRWPKDQGVIVAMPQVIRDEDEPLSDKMLAYAAEYFCTIGRAAREHWLKDGLTEMLISVSYQYTECYGGAGGSRDLRDAQSALYSSIDVGMRISVPERMESAGFIELELDDDWETQKLPYYMT